MTRSKMPILRNLLCAHFMAAVAATAVAGDAIEVEMQRVNQQGVGPTIGTVTIEAHEYGVLFTPALRGLDPGQHGLHLHQNADCAPATKDGKPVPAGAAGGHFDPDETGVHLGPYAEGHKGDLPAIFVDQNGEATQPVLAPRLELDDVRQKALMIHSGGDNYSDHPQALGGGGGRIACGVIGQ